MSSEQAVRGRRHRTPVVIALAAAFLFLVLVAVWLAVDRPPARRLAHAVETILAQEAEGLEAAERQGVAQAVLEAADRHDLDPLLLLSIIEQESEFRPKARGRTGARGLMQIRPASAQEIAEERGLSWKGAEALYEPDYNVALGAAYLAGLREQFESWELSLAAYNAGPTRVRATLRRGGQPPRGYARKVLGRRDEWRAETGLPAD
jgi:soluble lytic murein transglycosylase-like protein